MRILYASMMLPFPPTFGKRMEIWTTLRALVEEGHEVTLVSFSDPGLSDIDPDAIAAVCHEMDCVPMRISGETVSREYVRRIGAVLSPDPYSAWRFRSRLFEQRVAHHLAAKEFDAVLCGEVFMLPNIPASCTVPVILKKDHIATTILERHVAFEKNIVKKAYGLVELLKTRRWEPLVCRRASAIMACSELERDVLTEMCPGVPVTVGPNVVDVDSFRNAAAEEPRTILYHGLMDWYPNQDAVAYFISDILPALRRIIPDVKFVVAGRSSSDHFRNRFAGEPGVHFTGTVPDMRPIIQRCAVCVVPLRIASGTRFKILEAAAMGKAVVSTTIGAEGLNLVNGTEILIEDAPANFAQAVADLLLDDHRRRDIGQAGRERVKASYSMQVLRKALSGTLAAVSPLACVAENESGKVLSL